MPNFSSCTPTSGYQITCRQTAGVQAVYLGLWNGTSMSFLTGTDSIITGFTGSTVSFYTYEQEQEAATFAEKVTPSAPENGTVYYEDTVSIVLQSYTPAQRNQIALLHKGAFRALILDMNGTYWLVGATTPMRTNAGDNGIGQKYGDLYGSKLTLMTKSPVPAYIVSSAAALSLIQQ